MMAAISAPTPGDARSNPSPHGPAWKTSRANTGDELRQHVPVVFGSRSTYALCVIGGHEGRAIREGDVLPVGDARPAAPGRTVEERLRPALPNIAVDPFSVVQLLWREEALALLAQRGLATGYTRKNRWRIWEALVEGLEPDDLLREVRQRLKARREW